MIEILVSPNTTNLTVALSPTKPVVPGVPTNSAFKSWKPTGASNGTVRFRSTTPDASVGPTAETDVPLITTETCTPETAAPVLSISSRRAFTSSPLSVLSLSDGWFTPSSVGLTNVKTV